MCHVLQASPPKAVKTRMSQQTASPLRTDSLDILASVAEMASSVDADADATATPTSGRSFALSSTAAAAAALAAAAVDGGDGGAVAPGIDKGGAAAADDDDDAAAVKPAAALAAEDASSGVDFDTLTPDMLRRGWARLSAATKAELTALANQPC